MRRWRPRRFPPVSGASRRRAQIIFNDYLDAAVAAFFMISVIVILADSLREWSAVLRGRKPARSTEVPFEPVAVAGD